MEDCPSNDVIVVCDSRTLRRAEISKFLERWSNDIGADIVESDLTDFLRLMSCRNCVLCVLNVGGDFDRARIEPKMKLLSAIPSAPPIVVISDSEELDLGYAVFQHGGSAFIPTTMPPDVALSALSFVLAGGTYFPPQMLCCTPSRADQDAKQGKINHVVFPNVEPTNWPRCKPDPVTQATTMPDSLIEDDLSANLTARQMDVLTCLSQGKSNKEIARIIGVSESTVKVHVRQVMKKLSVTNRTQAALAAASNPNSRYGGDTSLGVRDRQKELH